RFSEWHRPQEGCLDLSNEEAREFAYELLTETVENTKSEYVHIGGDETWALGRGKSLNKTWKFEGPRLYELHHRNMIATVKKAGKRPILWGDMISGMYLRGESEKWAEALQSPIWKDVLVANWGYSPHPKQYFIDKIEIFKQRGIEQIACPGLNNWNRYYPNFQTALENLKNFLAAARETDLPGFLITAWGDDGEECLFSFLEPLLLASMEIAEGSGKWEQKWKAITGEDETVVNARILFGDPVISEGLKHVILRDFWFHTSTPETKEDMKAVWEKALEETRGALLPADLGFIRQMIEAGTKVFEDKAKVSDFLALSNSYSKLWLGERKPEGLERIVERFWGAAGRTDMKLR
ncbi:MAG: family 20 glycosylhydrolase, partial [Candidatus Bathyarchaeota archaeon]|nr:family 20 glycosylhydrolase [Candidatus Bathyarchaeota archaeon]